MGSLIGFYIACGEMTQKEASKLCGKLPTSISLQLNNEGKLKVNNSLVPKYRIANKGNNLLFSAKLTASNRLNVPENYISKLNGNYHISGYRYFTEIDNFHTGTKQ